VDRAYAKHDDSLIYTKVDRLQKNSHGDAGCTAFVKKLNNRGAALKPKEPSVA
jgi:hypothetical protein